jgi:hypothetical protein
MASTIYVGLAVTAHNNNALNTSTFTDVVVSGNLPPPWSNSDIGLVGQPGTALFGNGVFSVSGAGADIYDTSDGFQFVYQPWNGDGQLVARVTGVPNTNPYAKAGVMFREALTASARHAFMLVTAAQGTGFERRRTNSAVTAWTPGAMVSAPYWIKLVRNGTAFTSYASPDGATWTVVGSDTISMAPGIYAGLAVTSHTTTNLNTSTFDNVQFTIGTNGQPPRVSSVQFDPQTGVHLLLTGPAGGNYIIEASLDLLHWTNIGTVQNMSGSASFNESAATNYSQRYYRVRLY